MLRLFLLFVASSTILLSQSIHVQIGGIIPDKGLRESSGAGPMGTVSVILQRDHTSPVIAGVSLPVREGWGFEAGVGCPKRLNGV